MIEDEKKHMREITVFQFYQGYSTNFVSYILLSYCSTSQCTHPFEPYAIGLPSHIRRTIPDGHVTDALVFESIHAIVAIKGCLIGSVCVTFTEDLCFIVVIVTKVQVMFVSYCFGLALYALEMNDYLLTHLDSFEAIIPVARSSVPFLLFILLIARPKK
jgi:hypothetical protein